MAKSRVVTASLVGAVLGGIAGYLLFTDEGRSLRRRIEPALDDLARELGEFRATIQKLSGVMTEGRKLFDEAMAEDRSTRSTYPSIH